MPTILAYRFGIVKSVGQRGRLRAVEELAKLAAAVQRDTARAEKNRAALHDAIRRALAAGQKQADIARVTGYSRERLRQIAQD